MPYELFMTSDDCKSSTTYGLASLPRSGMAHFFAWCCAAPLLLLFVQLSYLFTKTGMDDKLAAVLVFAVGCIALVLTALIMGAARKRLGASLAGVLIGIFFAVLGYLVALDVYDYLVRWT
ncbi:hypothetical protein [Stenotrophomonas sp. TWI809]|uniref:hypothetical protein n=1 Tax=Stenotrophomonas sp. TWI809 TaxID=3136796 RepID=UPI003209FFFB